VNRLPRRTASAGLVAPPRRPAHGSRRTAPRADGDISGGAQRRPLHVLVRSPLRMADLAHRETVEPVEGPPRPTIE